MRRTASFLLTAALAAAPVTGLALPSALVAPAAAATTSVDHVLLNGFESRLAVEINSARRSAGLHPLTVVPGTTDVARRWAWKLAGAERLWHNPSIIGDLEHAGSGAWTDIAENVGYGPAQQPHTLFSAYMHSPEHRANILDPSVRYLGVGVVERDGYAYNTLDFTNAYSSGYGHTRVPAAGLTMDETSVTATTDLAMLERGRDQRFASHSHGSVHAGRIAFTGPSTGNDAAYSVLRRTRGGTGHGVVVMHDALDLSQATSLGLQVSAPNPRHRSVTVRLSLRRSFGSPVGLGRVTIPKGRSWVHVALPNAARTFRDALAIRVSAKSVRAAGGKVRLNVYDVRAS